MSFLPSSWRTSREHRGSFAICFADLKELIYSSDEYSRMYCHHRDAQGRCQYRQVHGCVRGVLSIQSLAEVMFIVTVVAPFFQQSLPFIVHATLVKPWAANWASMKALTEAAVPALQRSCPTTSGAESPTSRVIGGHSI